MPETKKASCLFCSLQCGFAMEMDAGVPVRVDFDTEARQNLGSLCVRGHYNHELLTHPKRFLAATVNRRRVPLASAVTKVASGVSEIKGSHGGDALGVIVGTELSNEDYDAAVAFASGVLGTPNVAVAYDGNDLPMLLGGGAGDATPEDLDSGDCFVLVGDVFWGHPCVSKRVISARHEARGNRVYTINPYRTNTDWFSDRHIAPTPGAEPVVLAGLLKAMNVQDAPDVSVAKAAEAAGLTEAELQSLAKNIKEHHNVVVLVSSRLGDSASGYLTGKLAAALAGATGGKYGPLFRGGNAVGAFERVGSAKTVPDILGGVADGAIKGLIVLGPDVLQLYPGALSADDVEGLTLLAASAVFENDVTKHSDVGLPQAVWTEIDGTYSASFGIETSISRVTAPQGDATSVATMLEKIASGLGQGFTVARAAAEHPPVEIDEAAALARLSSSDGELDFIECISPLHRWDGTITGRMSFAQSISPYCDVWIGEGAAAERGVEQGTTVALSTDRGETHIIATVTGRMPDGLVAIPSYVPDARGLLTWTANAGTRWFDVSAQRAKVTSEA
jgi:formate dehydrogenase major subunit